MYDLPIYVWALVLAGAIGIPAATSAALYRGAIAAGLGRRAATTVTAMTVAVLSGWLVVSGLLARAGVYRQDPGESVPWFLVAVGGTLIALVLATRIPLISRILADPGTPAAQVSIETGLSGVEITVPAATAARVVAETTLGSVGVGDGFTKREGAFMTDGTLSGERPNLAIRAGVRLGSLRLRTV